MPEMWPVRRALCLFFNSQFLLLGVNSSPRRCPQSSCETSAPHEIYYEELQKQKRGSPLWFPGPSSNVPLPYRHNGVNVGDVGVFRIDEPFDFLFNVFLPADHPINAKGVPEDFQPLEPGETFEERCDPNGGCIGSAQVSQSSNHGEQPCDGALNVLSLCKITLQIYSIGLWSSKRPLLREQFWSCQKEQNARSSEV